nr:DUF2892 domain-containing protein [Neobacillus sp. Marseille-Q6967]
MKITKNVGTINALIRITIGLTILAWSTSKMVKFPWRDSYLFIALCGAMKVAEGIVRFCPVTALFQEAMNNQNQSNRSFNEKESEDHFPVDEMVPYNPT